MDAQVKKGILEFCVLSELSKSESYGYRIIKDLSQWIEISESTLYPILRRLEAGQDVETCNVEYNSRIRKYYRITEKGRKRLEMFNSGQEELRKVLDYIQEAAKR